MLPQAGKDCSQLVEVSEVSIGMQLPWRYIRKHFKLTGVARPFLLHCLGTRLRWDICGLRVRNSLVPKPSASWFLASYMTFELSKVTCVAKHGAGDGLGTRLYRTLDHIRSGTLQLVHAALFSAAWC